MFTATSECCGLGAVTSMRMSLLFYYKDAMQTEFFLIFNSLNGSADIGLFLCTSAVESSHERVLIYWARLLTTVPGLEDSAGGSLGGGNLYYSLVINIRPAQIPATYSRIIKCSFVWEYSRLGIQFATIQNLSFNLQTSSYMTKLRRTSTS